MDLPVFYAPAENHRDNVIVLPPDESHHALDVLRLVQGDRVIVIDGAGLAHRGEIILTGGRPKSAGVRPYQEIRDYGEPMVHLTLAAGLSVGSKFDVVVEKGTELGVKRFVPFIGRRSKVNLPDPRRALARVRRLERVALAAVKQCRRSYRPDIAHPLPLSEYLDQIDASDTNLLFHPDSAASPLHALEWSSRPKRVVVMVGPESGFTSDEIYLAKAAGFVCVRLGPRILRTETAGPVVCALIMNRLGELS